MNSIDAAQRVRMKNYVREAHELALRDLWPHVGEEVRKVILDELHGRALREHAQRPHDFQGPWIGCALCDLPRTADRHKSNEELVAELNLPRRETGTHQ